LNGKWKGREGWVVGGNFVDLRKTKYIMKNYLFLLLIIPGFLFGQRNFEYKKDFEKILKETKKKDSELNYSNLLERYNKIDSTLTDKQVLSMLIAFTDNKYYKPYSDIDFGRNLYKLNDDDKYTEVIKSGNEFLSNHPFDIKTIIEVSYAYFKTDNKMIAKNYIKKANQIFNAMNYSGDAKSIDTPAFALNPSDGQDFIKKALGAKIGKMGSGRDDNNYFIDMLEAKFENGDSQMLYFIIPHATKKMFEK